MTGFLRVVAALLVLLRARGRRGLREGPRQRAPGGPPLETPPPPPRVVSSPIESEPTVTAVPPIEGPSPRTDARRVAPGGAASGAARTAAGRSEPDQVPAPPAAVPAPEEPPAHAADDGRTPTQAGAAQFAGCWRARTRDLSRIDYRALSVDAQAQYDIAKRFTEQADEAMKAKNFVFAEQLADKAAALAAQLLKR